MVARRSSRKQDKQTREREDLIRRAPDVSDGAKVLWIELQRGWAWDDTSCNPSQEALAFALGWSVRRVKRRLAELVGFDLIEVLRDEKHQRNTYVLAEHVPKKICDPKRLINKELLKLRQGTELSRGGLGTILSPGSGRVTEPSPDRCQNCPEAEDDSVPRQGTVVSYKDELHQDELQEDELKKMRELKLPPSEGTHPLGTESHNQEAHSNISTEMDDSSDEIDGLIEEVASEKPKAKRKKPNPRKRRGVDKSLLGLKSDGRGQVPSPAAETDYVQAVPPPIEAPNDVHALFYSEILKKYGEKLASRVPHTLEARERGQIKTCLLSKYDPDVIVDMIRILVWDWEVARSACWPTSVDIIPSIKHLVQYRTALSSNSATGFDYTGSQRGNHKTYARQYLGEGKDTPDCADPF